MSDAEPVTYANFGQRLKEEIPSLAAAVDELREWLPDDAISPGTVMTQVFGPAVARPEMDAHRTEPPAPHDCRADDLVRWAELMADCADEDVVNELLIEVFEGRDQAVALRFPWGPRTREVLEQWPPW